MLVVAGFLLTAPGAAWAEDPGGPGTQADAPLGLDRLDQREFGRSTTYSWTTTGRSVHAYVLGDRIATTHTTFGGRASLGADFTSGSTANAVRPAVAVLNITHPVDAAVDAAARRLVDSGVTLVTTSGDVGSSGDRDSRDVSPARIGEVITVGRTWANIVELAVTRIGPNVDIFAPFSTMAIGSGNAEYDITLNSAGWWRARRPSSCRCIRTGRPRR
jgi:hypothetical protein